MAHKSKVVSTHLSPFWKSKGDSTSFVNVSDEAGRVELEELWGQNLSANSIMVCCIPFFAYDLALGDVVEIDNRRVLKKLIAKSGHATLRAWFKDCTRTVSESIAVGLHASGIGIEWSSQNLLAIDAATSIEFERVQKLLHDQSQKHGFVYEVACAPLFT